MLNLSLKELKLMAKREVLKAIKSRNKYIKDIKKEDFITDKVFRDIRTLFESGNEDKN